MLLTGNTAAPLGMYHGSGDFRRAGDSFVPEVGAPPGSVEKSRTALVIDRSPGPPMERHYFSEALEIGRVSAFMAHVPPWWTLPGRYRFEGERATIHNERETKREEVYDET